MCDRPLVGTIHVTEAEFIDDPINTLRPLAYGWTVRVHDASGRTSMLVILHG